MIDPTPGGIGINEGDDEMRSIIKVNGGWQDPNGGQKYDFVAGTCSLWGDSYKFVTPFGIVLIKASLVDQQVIEVPDSVTLSDTDCLKVLN